MKDIKLSFPYPSTSRHNLSQDVSTSLSMGLVTPVRVVKVLPGDSHRIATSFSLISNPLVKPLLQGVRMRYCRFWVPSRIYNLDQRANNSNFDPLKQPVRIGAFPGLNYPVMDGSEVTEYFSNFQQSSLFDYLGLSAIESNFISSVTASDRVQSVDLPRGFLNFNVEPYLGYVDICRNYFADSASGMVAWSSRMALQSNGSLVDSLGVIVSPLKRLDDYIDNIQNSRATVLPYDPTVDSETPDLQSFRPFVLWGGYASYQFIPRPIVTSGFSVQDFGISHNLLCVPLNRPDRLSRLFDTRPLTSQNATIAPNEVTIGNLSFLAKLQRFLTRRFFGGSRFTDVMYSVFGQNVPHVDSPVLLDVFDSEIGSELVASTNATETQNPGVLGGYFSASGLLSTGRGRSRKRYTFNENGYLIDVVYIMPRLNRSAFLPDFYPVTTTLGVNPGDTINVMQQGNFVPDFNGIGWQQPSFVSKFVDISTTSDGSFVGANVSGFCCEPSWQQYRTLPDVCHGALNPLRSAPSVNPFTEIPGSLELNSPLFTFNDRMNSNSVLPYPKDSRYLLASQLFSSFNDLNRVFGSDKLTYDNIFVVFRYAHQAKRQVSKRFTLTFN